MSNITVSRDDGFFVFALCFILFHNFGDNQYDLYDAIMHWLLK